MSMSDLRFLTRTSAPTWEDGLIVGSGRVGAIAHGAVDRLVVSFAHERFFLPANARPAAPDLTAVLTDMRERLFAGDGDGATDILSAAAAEEGYRGLIWTDPLGMCGRLTVESPGGVAEASRTIDLRRGLVEVSWTDLSGGRHGMRLVAPRGGDTIWLALESERSADVALRLDLEDADDGPAASFAPDYAGSVTAAVTPGDPGVLDVHDAGGEPLAQVRASGAVWRAAGAGALDAAVDVPAGGRVVLRFDLSVAGRSRVVAPAADWQDILDVHTRSHQDLVDASLLDLDGAGADTVEEVWAAAREGHAASRRRAVEIAYASGRANIIASTGELPPTLQGVWQGTWKPAWSADYTLNGNVQNGAMAGMIPTGTPELASSLLELVLPFLDDYRENAARVFGADGMLLPSRMSTHGKADHFNAQFPHLFWTGCGAWVLRMAADLVSTTGDRSIVDDRLWELAGGVLRFAETATVGRGARRHIVPSYSPENTPGGAAHPLAVDSTMDIALFRDAARAARVLGRARGDLSLDARWVSLAEAMPEYRIATDGTLAEWIGDAEENHAHRHASQLYPLWYETDPAFAGTDERAQALRAAALRSVRTKIEWRAVDPTPPPGRMEMAFGLVQLGMAAAALGDAESALTCVEWLAIDHWTPALTSRHDAGRIFNLDASGGLPGLVASMLLASTEESLTLFPALPESWRRGGITGLRARGGIVIDRLEWDEEGWTAHLRRLADADWLRPDGRVAIRAGRPDGAGRAPEPAAEIVVPAGEAVTLRRRWQDDRG